MFLCNSPGPENFSFLIPERTQHTRGFAIVRYMKLPLTLTSTFTFLVHADVEALLQSAGATLVPVDLVDGAHFRFVT